MVQVVEHRLPQSPWVRHFTHHVCVNVERERVLVVLKKHKLAALLQSVNRRAAVATIWYEWIMQCEASLSIHKTKAIINTRLNGQL